MQKLKDKRFILSLIGGGVLLFAWLLLWMEQGRRRVEWFQDDLIARGERLEWSQIVSNPPADVSNGWDDVFLRPGVRVPTTRIPVLAVLSKNHGGIGKHRCVSNYWNDLEGPVNGSRHLWQTIAGAATKDVIIPDLDWSRGHRLRLPHLTNLKQFANWCGKAVEYDLHIGANERSLDTMIQAFQVIKKCR